MPQRKSLTPWALTALCALLIAASPIGAERLAVHTYTVADGLAGDQVTVLIHDHRGFLWIGTGLSRFDGISFPSFDSKAEAVAKAMRARLI